MIGTSTDRISGLPHPVAQARKEGMVKQLASFRGMLPETAIEAANRHAIVEALDDAAWAG